MISEEDYKVLARLIGDYCCASAHLADILPGSADKLQEAANLAVKAQGVREKIKAARELVLTPEEFGDLVKVDNLLTSFYFDWDRLNAWSPDHDPTYKPELPPEVLKLRTIMQKLAKQRQLSC
jgi:hypothetical protein